MEYLNKLVVEPIDDILISPCLKAFIMDIWHQCWKLVKTIFVSSQSMSSGCLKWLLSLIHVRMLKDVAVNSRRIYFVSSGIISNWSCMCGLFLRWQVVASLFLKISYMHTKPLTDLFENEKKSKTFTIFFRFFSIRTRLCFIAISSC
jgi:hypothetical protein